MGTWASQPPPAPRDGRLRGWSWGAWVRPEAERKASKAESAESINRSSKQRMLEKAPITMGKMALPWEEKFILLLHC